MKLLSKIFNTCLVIMLIMVNLLSPIKVEAKTLGDLERELTKLEEESNSTHNQIELTESEIGKVKSEISQIYKDMASIEDEIIEKTNEIEQLNLEIEEKDVEIKELMNFLQISNGGSVYLEYIMGASSLTDFIYRISITEQMTKYNNELMDKMDKMIKENEERKVELKKQEGALEQKQATLDQKLKSLGSKRQNLYENERSLEEEIKVAKEVIKMYKAAGCKSSEDISVCANKLLPPDTRFWRPMIQGYVTSEFGVRLDPFGSGKLQGHAAMDMSNSDKYNTRIYSVANGKVAKIFYDKYGGNQVVVHHKILVNGTYKKYTSTYVHLASVWVRDGDVLTKDTVIGIMGNTGNSTGPHLHLAISNGHRYVDYVTYNSYVANSFNPRLVINFPRGPRNYWYNRTTKY